MDVMNVNNNENRRLSTSSSSDGLEDGQYTVEKVVGKMINDDGTFYLLKWEDYPESDNTWEHASKIFCPELIQQFEDEVIRREREEKRNKREKREQKKARKKEAKVNALVLKVTEEAKTNDNDGTGEGEVEPGKDEGEDENKNKQPMPPKYDEVKNKTNVAEIVIGATKVSEVIYYVVKWEDSDEISLLTFEDCKEKCPQALISYFERNISWNTEINIELMDFDSDSGSSSTSGSVDFEDSESD